MTLRWKRILLRLAIHGSVAVAALLAMVLSQFSASGLFAVALAGYLATLRVNPLPGLLERGLFQEVKCFSCGEVTDLVNNWTCGCGFQTWQPRHGLSPCLHCRKVYNWLQCPHCDAGILT